MKKDKIIAICLGLALIIGFGFIYKVRIDEKKNNEEIISSIVPVEIGKIQKSEISDYIKYTGKVTGSEEANVTKMSPGKITEVLVKNGDFVDKGDILIKLDSSSVDGTIKKAEESYNKALEGKEEMLNSMEKAESDKDELLNKLNENKKALEEKKKKLESLNKELVELNKELVNGSITNEEFAKRKEELEKEIGYLTVDISKLTKEVSSDSIKYQGIEKSIEGLKESDILDSSVKMAEAMYKNTLKLRDNFKIVAPVSGRVTNLYAKVGDEGIDPMNPLMEIINTNKIHIPIGVDKDELKNFKVGDNVSCEILNGKKEIKKTGKVVSVGDRKDKITEQYKVVVEVDNSDSTIKKGDYGKVFIPVGNKKEAEVISKDALLREGDKTFVYIVEDNIAKKKEVKLRGENDDFVEISSGINKEDKVIVKGKEYVKNGEKVNVVGGEE